jgi:hypothetical protein
MADLIYVAVIIAFFGLAALFVVACDRIIGADVSAVTGTREPAPEPAPSEDAAAA